MKKIGIVGSGPVGLALAKGFVKHGYNVMLGTRDKSKYEQLHKDTGAATGSLTSEDGSGGTGRRRPLCAGFRRGPFGGRAEPCHMAL